MQAQFHARADAQVAGSDLIRFGGQLVKWTGDQAFSRRGLESGTTVSGNDASLDVMEYRKAVFNGDDNVAGCAERSYIQSAQVPVIFDGHNRCSSTLRAYYASPSQYVPSLELIPEALPRALR